MHLHMVTSQRAPHLKGRGILITPAVRSLQVMGNSQNVRLQILTIEEFLTPKKRPVPFQSRSLCARRPEWVARRQTEAEAPWKEVVVLHVQGLLEIKDLHRPGVLP